MRSKIECEICKNSKKKILHYHHIIPRIDSRCTNSNENIAIVCPNCHSEIHLGNIIIIGNYKSTAGYTLLWFFKENPPPLPFESWLIKENPLVNRKI